MALRRFHVLLLSAAVLAAVGSCAKPPANTDPQANALIERIGRQELARRPEQADEIGISPDVFGSRYDLLLDDRSIAAAERARVQHLAGLEQLHRLDPATLSPAVRRQVAIATASLDGAVRMERFGYGSVGLGWASPYIIDQVDGAWLETPRFLALHHTVASRADADAWLTRLKLLDDAIIADTRRFQGDLDQGIVPPKSIIERTLAAVRAQRPADPRAYFLIDRFREHLAVAKDLPTDEQQRYLDEATLAVRNKVLPAYDDLIRLLEATLPKAVDDPSVTRLPKGAEWYAEALKLYTNSDITPDQVHSLGLALVKEFSDEMNGILSEAGQPEGSVGQRMQTLAADPARHYPDTEEGRTSLLAAIDAQISWASEKLPRFVSAKPKAKLTVRPAPQIVGAGSPGAYYVAGSLDGSRPATFYINLRTTLDWPMFALPTLTYHETLPGHHLQGGLARETPGAALIQTLSAFPAYSEGWAVYAEDLASEMGAYDTEATGRLGYLQSLLFRAARLVVDTGLHAKKWSREQAIDYLVSTTGLPRAQMTDEVDRYIVWPGQACAYMAGREKIRALRDDADTELGQSFDLKGFNDAVLEGGARPLAVLESDIHDWVNARKPKAAAPASPK